MEMYFSIDPFLRSSSNQPPRRVVWILAYNHTISLSKCFWSVYWSGKSCITLLFSGAYLYFWTHFFPLIVPHCLFSIFSTLLPHDQGDGPAFWYPIEICLWLVNSSECYLQQLNILPQIYQVINSVWMWGASLLNPPVDTLMITTINADGFNGPLSECLSCSAVLNNNVFVPQKQHGQKAHFLTLRAPAARAVVLRILLLGRKMTGVTTKVGRGPVLQARAAGAIFGCTFKARESPLPTAAI